MQNFYVYETTGTFFLTDAADCESGLRVDSLAALLRLRARLSRYIDDQVSDGFVPVTVIEESDWIDAQEAVRMSMKMGKPISETGLRNALGRGKISGAVKQSVSGLAKTEGGGQWRMPRSAFLLWNNKRSGK